jgi:hypothetical protein
MQEQPKIKNDRIKKYKLKIGFYFTALLLQSRGTAKIHY